VKNASGTPNRLIYTGFISSSSTTTSDPTLSDPTSNTSGSSDPTASFTYSCSGTTCTFDASASTAPLGLLSRTWMFGDGSQAGSAKVTKTYAKSGTYTVKFYIYDVKMNYDVVTKSITTGTSGSGGSETSTSTSSTTWTYKCGTNRVCDFDARALEDAGGSAFSWYFGDGTQAGSSHVAQKWYAKSGSYTVKMTMVKDGKVVAIQKTVSVP
jgi:PKD repeat protein